MSTKEPLLYNAEHIDVTRDCPLSSLTPPLDCDTVLLLVGPDADARRMPWACCVEKGNQSWDSSVVKKKVVRRLTLSFL